MAKMAKVRLDGASLTLEQVEAIAHGADVGLTAEAKKRVRASRKVVDHSTRDGR